MDTFLKEILEPSQRDIFNHLTRMKMTPAYTFKNSLKGKTTMPFLGTALFHQGLDPVPIEVNGKKLPLTSVGVGVVMQVQRLNSYTGGG